MCLWNEARLLSSPKYPWEVIQIGNCGAPLETEAGWLLLTHGVGPMRRYCIGAALLDLDNPCRVIGQTNQPLLIPTGSERFGYVPNVVYSCGGMIHQGMLVLPYAASDLATCIAVIDLEELLAALVPPPRGAKARGDRPQERMARSSGSAWQTGCPACSLSSPTTAPGDATI